MWRSSGMRVAEYWSCRLRSVRVVSHSEKGHFRGLHHPFHSLPTTASAAASCFQSTPASLGKDLREEQRASFFTSVGASVRGTAGSRGGGEGRGVVCVTRGNRSAGNRDENSKWELIKASMSGAKMKELARKYGPVAFVYHTSVYIATLSSLYYGIGHGMDVASILAKIPFVDLKGLDPTHGQFAAAYAAAMITGPLRAVITVTTTPRVARVWHNHIKARPAPIVKKEENRIPSSKM